jgi:predicted acylesterase/phospholipase RssA
MPRLPQGLFRKTMPQTDEPLGLALSGGGFRATLFHLGVVRALAEAGLLSRVTHITSVSGGSVLAAHLVLNWNAYAESSRAFARAGESERSIRAAAKLFDDATKPLLDFIATDVRNRIIRRLPLNLFLAWIARIFGSTLGYLSGETIRNRVEAFADRRGLLEQLVHNFEGLFGGKKLCDLSQPGAPRLVILTTEVASMKLGSFTSDGFNQPGAEGAVGRDILTVARSVAASAAFPALFPPARLDGEEFRLPLAVDSFVTDAGVYDNLGISAFLGGQPFAGDKFPVLVSDATATSEWSSTNVPNLLTNLLRSVDIMQQRAAQLQRDKVNLPQRDARAGNAAKDGEARGRFVLFDIAREDIREEPKIGETAQRHVSYLRTDLDAFNDEEMRLLVHHGYAVAWHTLKHTGHVPAAAPAFFGAWRQQWPRAQRTQPTETHAVGVLRAGRRSRLRFFEFSDPVGIMNTAAVIALAMILPVAFVVEKQKRTAAEAEMHARAEVAHRKFAVARIESFRNFRFDPKPPVRHAGLPAEVRTDSFDGIAISAFEKMFDLRNWLRVPPELRQLEPVEYALQQTIYTVRRESHASSVAFRLKTTGLGIMPEVPTLDAKLYQETVAEERFPKQVLAHIDLTRIPPDMEYPVIVRGTFWNGFQKPVEDASFKTYTKGDHGRMVVIFPELRLPRRFVFWRIVGPAPIEAMSPPPFHLFHQNGLYFEVERPEVNCTYGVQFTWDDEGTGPMGKVTPELSPVLLSR